MALAVIILLSFTTGEIRQAFSKKTAAWSGVTFSPRVSP